MNRSSCVLTVVLALAAAAQAAPPKNERPGCFGKTVTPRTRGHCCWPGQAWSQAKLTCAGEPSSCPDDWHQQGEACVPTPLEQDGMMHVPAGTFSMGGGPVTHVTLSALWIDKTEVTVEAYRSCVDAQACTRPAPGPNGNWQLAGREKHPVNGVDWWQAQAYCGWVGKRLPTEAEWEYAARGLDFRWYPWGSDKPSAGSISRGTMPVGSLPLDVSPFGVVDMAGNVSEWVADVWGDQLPTGKNPRRTTGKTPGLRVYRGGSGDALLMVDRFSAIPRNGYDTIGFRCARDADWRGSCLTPQATQRLAASCEETCARRVDEPEPLLDKRECEAQAQDDGDRHVCVEEFGKLLSADGVAPADFAGCVGRCVADRKRQQCK